jgi:SulP family sulfate permease
MNIEKMKKLVGENMKSGVTVACVSIPLSIAIAIASGGTPESGIITGFWATIIAAMFGGSKFNVIGPAGALTSVLFAATVAPAIGLSANIILPMLAIFSGLIIFIVYVLGLDKYVKLIPEVIVHGFAGGVAFVIASTQLREALGIAHTFKASGHFLHDMQNIILNIPATHLATFICFAVFLSFLILWKKHVKSIPGVIPATVMGIVLGLFAKNFSFTEKILTVGDKYGELKLSLINFFEFSNFNLAFANAEIFLAILKVAAVVALISILETLITAKIGDSLTKTEFSPKKETFGLALSNIFSGFLGGLPATGVFIRTGLNIKSGATHSVSSVIAGLVTGLGAVFLMPYFQFIPMSVIAAMLMMTALGLIDVSHFSHLFKHNKFEFLIGIITIILVIVLDPAIAVGAGIVLYYIGINKDNLKRFFPNA